MKKLSKNEYIARATEIHGDRYDYRVCDYQTMKIKISIVCRVHKLEFDVSPAKHLAGQGCPRCKTEKMSALHQIDNDEFIRRATDTHGTTYDYSKCNYVNNQQKVEIICREHGSFWVTPNNHTSISNRTGCPTCARRKMGPNRKTTEWFITQAKKIHGDKFDYSISTYRGCFEPITIKCRDHGMFEQKAYQHFDSSICCPQCTKSVSVGETEWLDYLGISVGFRQKRINVGGKSFIVDAIDYRSNTIYEFYGDYWHGNPETMNQSLFNDRANATYGELYQKTKERETILKENGNRLKRSIFNTSNTQSND